MEFNHESVLLFECIEALNIKPDGIYIDGTTGGGGHSIEIVKKLAGGKLFCLDKDPDAIEAAKKRLSKYLDKTEFIECDFKNAKLELEARAVAGIDGMLLDLGVSSHQLDSPSRGFSYHHDTLLDMRMSKSGISAKDIVNDWAESELSRLIFDYGEEKYARSIAKSIVKARAQKEISTSLELVDIIKASMPEKAKRGKNPARKTFQALRIAVNDEIDMLPNALKSAFSFLNPGGRLVVISFHSIEDRVVKQTFLELVGGCNCPKSFPICVCGESEKARRITRKPMLATEEELLNNRRSRSAKLRVLEKI